ncbi:hypothetical protein JKP88DRAFT_218632, partial [Tribonema minus]
MVTTTGRLVFGGSGPAEQQDDDDKLQQLAKEEGNRSKAVAELLSTEKTFVSEMTLLVEVFLEPLRRYGAELAAEAEAAAEDRADAGKARLAVTPEDLTVIFSNVEQLLGFNRCGGLFWRIWRLPWRRGARGRWLKFSSRPRRSCACSASTSTTSTEPG